MRIYTAEFGRNLQKCYDSWCALPAKDRADLRVRRSVDATKTDKELFEEYPLGDLWIESGIHEVYFYLAGCKYCQTLACAIWQYVQFVFPGMVVLPVFPENNGDPVVSTCSQDPRQLDELHGELHQGALRQCILGLILLVGFRRASAQGGLGRDLVGWHHFACIHA